MPHTFMTGWRRSDSPKATVFIAIPTYGQPYAATVNSINAAQHYLSAHGVNGYVSWLSGMCHVDDARNNMCARFLQTEDATHLMFVDADVTFDANAIYRLLDRDEAMIAGIYPYKNDIEGFPVIADKNGEVSFDERGLIEAKGVPGGFMCIRRDVIERLTKKNSKKGVWPEKADYNLPIVEIFHRTIEMGRSRRSGDYEFCDKVRRAGYKIWVEPNIQFGHVGEKVWTGNYMGYLLRQSGKYEQMAAECLNKPDMSQGDFRTVSAAFDNAQFAADEVLLSVLYGIVKGLDRPKVLETGSGASTAVMMAAGGSVTALEDVPIWGDKTQRFLQAAGFDPRGVKYAPQVVKEGVGRWYDAAHFNGDYDVVFIDGPRRALGGERERICSVLPDVLRSAQCVVVDDTDDQDGRNVLARLHKDFGFRFDAHKGPRREFSVGTRDE